MKRNILDYQGNVIGELELPDGTSESVWADRLSTFAKPPPVTAIPNVSPRQIRQALILQGISLSQIETALDGLPEPTRSLAKIEWEYSVGFVRANPLVAQVAVILGWTPEQLDALWVFAGSL